MKFTKRTYTKAYERAFANAKEILLKEEYAYDLNLSVHKYAVLATRIRKRAAREGYGYYL